MYTKKVERVVSLSCNTKRKPFHHGYRISKHHWDTVICNWVQYRDIHRDGQRNILYQLGGVTQENISRWTGKKGSYRSLQRLVQKSINWLNLNVLLLQSKPTTNPIPIYPIPSSFGFQNCGSSSPSSDILQSWIRLSTSFSQISGSIWYCLQAEKKV